MDVIGSEIGQKMRSAIKAKLTEIGCYVDDELPDYVMVMVANKRTRSQMEEDLRLFLGGNTELFVNWLHQVLKKLQEVTINSVLKPPDQENPQPKPPKETSSIGKKEAKLKEKRLKDKVKAKKKSKKESKKKEKEERKKSAKSKKKEKETESIRPKVPPLLMNMERVSSPSITDVFAGQILKSHGINMKPSVVSSEVKERKPLNRQRFPIIDPATVSQIDDASFASKSDVNVNDFDITPISEMEKTLSSPLAGQAIQPREEQIKEMNEIEAKIQGLKKKLAEQIETLSEDEDFLNIRTEAEELMGVEFGDDASKQSKTTDGTTTPPLAPNIILHQPIQDLNQSKEATKDNQELPQIELLLPKRPLRERLGVRNAESGGPSIKYVNKVNPMQGQIRRDREEESLGRESKLPSAEDNKGRYQSIAVVKIKTEGVTDYHKSKINDRISHENLGSVAQRLSSRVTTSGSVASVVRVRPRPRVNAAGAANSALLLRAMADAHKSLLNIPPKVETDSGSSVKKALVMPMRRHTSVDAQKIVIQVSTAKPSATDSNSASSLELDTESLDSCGSGYVPAPLAPPPGTHQEYVPTVIDGVDEERGVVAKLLNSRDIKTEDEKGPQFVVTLDGLDPNLFLNKKLQTEGILIDSEPDEKGQKKSANDISDNNNTVKEVISDVSEKSGNESPKDDKQDKDKLEKNVQKTSPVMKELVPENVEPTSLVEKNTIEVQAQARKRKASPIVFDVKETKAKIVKEKVSAKEDVVKKYDSLPSLSPEPRASCKSFPACAFGTGCVFAHPPCRFGAACTRRACTYTHTPLSVPVAVAPPAVASRVVPASNYKTITSSTVTTLCKFYPNCSNPTCHFLHPKLCWYGRGCLNKLQCNFYHHELPKPNKWKSPFKV